MLLLDLKIDSLNTTCSTHDFDSAQVWLKEVEDTARFFQETLQSAKKGKEIFSVLQIVPSKVIHFPRRGLG